MKDKSRALTMLCFRYQATILIEFKEIDLGSLVGNIVFQTTGYEPLTFRIYTSVCQHLFAIQRPIE